MNAVRGFVRLTAVFGAVSLAVVGCSGAGSAGDDEANVVAADCEPAASVTTIEPGTLSVGAYAYPPYSDPENASEPGIELEILQRFAEENCLALDVNNVSAAARVESVRTGRADLGAGSLIRTKKRAEVVGLSDPIMLQPYGVASPDGKIATVEDLIDSRIGVTEGWAITPQLKELLGDSLSVYQATAPAYRDLQTGRIDGVIDTVAAAKAAVQAGAAAEDVEVKELAPDPRLKWTTEPAAQTALIYDQSATSLGTALNSFIADLRADGTLDEIVSEYGLPESQAHPGEPILADR